MSKVYFDLFTDGASYNNGRKDKSKPEHSSSAGILCFNKKVVREFAVFNPHSTNNYGEINAIYMALKNSYKVMKNLKSIKPPYRINLYSDSMICVQGLTAWIYGWMKTERNGVWYNSSGTEVANQKVFENIYKEFILNEDMDLNIYHIRGHMDTKKKSDMQKAYKLFIEVNRRNITLNELIYLIDHNNKCDKLATEVLKENI